MVPVVPAGRRERKKAAVRAHISDVATSLFAAHGFDAVSVSDIAEAADVARPTVFAYFPRKEDLVFDRYPDAAAALADAVGHSNGRPWRALRDHLVAQGSSIGDQRVFWRLVAGSRALQARARELAEHLEATLARALGEQGVTEPELCAALVAAAYRSVHVDAIRRVLADEPIDVVVAERAQRLGVALAAVEHASTHLSGRRDARTVGRT